MKKVMLLILFLIVSGIIASEEIKIPDIEKLETNISLFVQLDLLTDFGMYKTEEGIKAMSTFSLDLDPYYKDILFDRYGKNPLGTATLNLFTGGFGSIIEGSYITGIITQTGIIASYTAAIVGIVTYNNPELRETLFLGAKIGGTVFTLLGIGLPFLDAWLHNRKINRAYNITK